LFDKLTLKKSIKICEELAGENITSKIKQFAIDSSLLIDSIKDSKIVDDVNNLQIVKSSKKKIEKIKEILNSDT